MFSCFPGLTPSVGCTQTNTNKKNKGVFWVGLVSILVGTYCVIIESLKLTPQLLSIKQIRFKKIKDVLFCLFIFFFDMYSIARKF